MTYSKCGDYLVPNLRLMDTGVPPLGKYGRMRKRYLEEHRPILWNTMILSEKLYPHLREVDKKARNRMAEIMSALMEQSGVNEELKAANQMKWVGLMNTLTAQAEEIILAEIVYR